MAHKAVVTGRIRSNSRIVSLERVTRNRANSRERQAGALSKPGTGSRVPFLVRSFPSEGDDLARMNRVVRSDDDLQALDRVVHVIGEIDILVDRLQADSAVHARKARRDRVRRSCRSARRASTCRCGAGGSGSVLVWALMSSDFTLPAVSAMTIDTEPFGPTTSFTKKAVSLIIGPQPASYQPTEPSSKIDLQHAVVVDRHLVGQLCADRVNLDSAWPWSSGT